MAKINGGIIGPNNPTGPFSAGGVWRLEDAFNAQKAGTWPVILGYQVPNSLRFESGSSDYLSRTPASQTNRKTWTWSGWVKRSVLDATGGIQQDLFAVSTGATTFTILYFPSNTDTLVFYQATSGGTDIFYSTEVQYFRDVSAWYHFVLAVDTTQATASNRVKLYLNGSYNAWLIGNPTNPNQNSDTYINTTNRFDLGSQGSGFTAGTNAFNGYMSEIHFIDGQQLDASSFGETDATTGIWKPKAYTGTYGTNGFYLNFANSADLGNDVSGNNNDFTANNLTSIDQSYDSPTNNFATLNNLAGSSQAAASTFSEGNLKIVASGTNYRPTPSTIGVSAGKWYAEFLLNAAAGDAGFGIMGNQGTADANWGGNVANNYWWYCGTGAGTPGVYSNNSLIANGGIGTMTTNDIGMIAIDLDNNRVYFGKNGTFLNSSNPASGTNPYSITAATSTELGFYFFTAGDWGGATRGNWSINFGYPPFTISSGNADANGFGNFEYAVPSGYYALCSKNLALYG